MINNVVMAISTFGGVVKRLRRRPVTADVVGSSSIGVAISGCSPDGRARALGA